MQSFLSVVAHDLYTRTGGDLSHTVVVFPGKRASLFFNQCLVRESSGQPLFAPTYLTLGDLFGTLSDLRAEDPIRTVCLLHRVFNDATHRTESIDSFYAWGQLLLSDFDDIDKNLVDAHSLFCNLSDYRALSSPEEYLTAEQREVLNQFFCRFDAMDDDSRLRENFVRVWEKMEDMYVALRSQLRSENRGYDGMIYRDAVENFDAGRLTAERYAFVGFNVLSKVEETLFKKVKETGKALFYWDYDSYYMDDKQEAGQFIKRNIRLFGSALADDAFPADDNPFDRLRHLPSIDVVSAATDNAQAGFVHDWLENHLTDPAQETAVVLCDETLLQPVLRAFPDSINGEVNVTMGLPMTQTSVFHFLKELIDADAENEESLSEHLQRISDAIDAKGLELKQRDDRLQADEEALYRAHLAVANLLRLTNEGTLKAGRRLADKLLMQILRTTSIPFHGEPARGLQVMGVLETRNLDFRHLLVLSTDEGKLPRPAAEVSFIPFTLRKAFGLTTIERQTAVYAYYFYHMLQRAEHVTLVCNNGTDGIEQRTPSRFITQLQMEHPGIIRTFPLLSEGTMDASDAMAPVAQTDDTRRKLRQRFAVSNPTDKAPLLSPSALNTYLCCPLKFYFSYVEGLRFRSESTEEVTLDQFGTLFHKSAELAYKHLTAGSHMVQRSDLEALAKNDVALFGFVDAAFREEYFSDADGKPLPDTEPLPYNGIHLVNRQALKSLLRQLLQMDAAYAPFRYDGSEQRVFEQFTIDSHGQPFTICMGGFMDRFDTKQGVTRIVDYKTGGSETGVDNVEALFDRVSAKRKSKVFQAFYYAWLMSRKQPDTAFSPALLYTSKTASKDYDPVLKLGKQRVENFREQAGADFEKGMMELLNEIFNSDVPYTQNPSADACKYCDFLSICNRKPKEFDK